MKKKIVPAGGVQKGTRWCVALVGGQGTGHPAGSAPDDTADGCCVSVGTSVHDAEEGLSLRHRERPLRGLPRRYGRQARRRCVCVCVCVCV